MRPLLPLPARCRPARCRPVLALLLLGLLATAPAAWAQNYALQFDGDEQYVRVDDKDLINRNKGSLELWFRPDDVASTGMLVYGGDGGNGFGGEDEFHLHVNSNGKVALQVYQDGDRVWDLASTTTLSAGTWYHVAATWDGDATVEVKLYLDGTLEDEVTYATFSTDAWDDEIRFGAHADIGVAGNRSFEGQIDEVRFWFNEVRSSREVQDNMHVALSGTESGLEGYYTFSPDFSSDTVIDLAGGDQNGTLVNMDRAYVTADYNEPVLTATAPEDDAVAVALDADLVLTFDRPVTSTFTSGEIRLVETATGTAVATLEAGSSAVTFDGETVTVVHGATLALNTAYHVEVETGGTIAGDLGTAWTGIDDEITWNFVTEDIPVLASLVPADGATEVGLEQDLVLTFEDPVQAGSGTIRLVEAATDAAVATIDVTSAAVTIDGETVTMAHGAALAPSTDHYVEVDGGAIEGLDGSAWPGIDDATTWTFTTVDTPVLLTRSPADGEEGVGLEQDLVLTFDRTVQAGSGAVRLVEAATDAVAATIDVTSAAVTIDGETVTVAHGAVLAPGTDHYVEVDDGAFVGLLDNPWAGIDETTAWTFTTIDVPVLLTRSPADGEEGVGLQQDLTLTFDRAMQAGSGAVRLVEAATGAVAATVDVTSAAVTIDGETVTVAHGAVLAPGTDHYVEVDDGAFVGLLDNPWAGINETTAWTFTTIDVPVLLTRSPADGEEGVGLQQDLTLTFDRAMQAGSGAVRLVEAATGAVATVDVTSAAVTIDGETVTVAHGAVLAPGTDHYVEVDDGAFMGLLDNPWEGISGSNTWTFTTTRPSTDPGFALHLDGVDDYLSVNGLSSLLGEAFTIEVSTRPDEIGSATSQFVLGFHDANGGNELLFYYVGNDAERFRIWDGSEDLYIGSEGDYPEERWYHVALTVSTDRTLTILIDGEVVFKRSGWTLLPSSTSLFTLGQEWDGLASADGQYRGAYDELRIWDGERTEEDLRASRFTALTGEEEDLLAYFQFSEGSGTTTSDVVGGQVATLYSEIDVEGNGPTWSTSTLPLGAGVTASADEAPGTVVFGDTGVEMTYLAQSGAPVVVTRLDGAPSTLPADVTEALDDQYWVIDRYGTGLFNATLTFALNEDLTASDAAVPEQIQLYSRPTGADASADWTFVGSARSVDAAANTATFGEIRTFSQFLVVRGAVLGGEVVATDGLFEDRVEVTWQALPAEAALLEIERTLYAETDSAETVSLSLLASDETLYTDLTGDPGVTYAYCVVVLDDGGTTIDTLCDDGRRTLFAPTGADATDATLADHVLITWTDRSGIEAGFHVYRDDDLLVTLDADASSYEDTTAVAETVYTYCVTAFDADGFASETTAASCDEGERGVILPPLGVAASDGQYPDRVVVSWTDQTDDETGYRIDRDGTPLDTTAADATRYEDTTADTGATYTYCVYTLTSEAASVGVCDDGGVGILPAPTGVTASVDTYDDRVEIVWTDPGDTEDAFRVYRDDTLLVEITADVETYLDLEATPGTDYAYCVVAVAFTDSDDDGEADQEVESDALCADGRRSPVLAPLSVDAADGDDEDQVVLTWENPSTTAVLMKIYRDSTLIKTTVSGTTTYTDTGIASDTEHTYCVVGTTASGDASAWANDADDEACDTGYRSLAPPTEVTATDNAEEDVVAITWTDASEAEAGYRVYRDDGAAAELIGTTSAGVEAFEDYAGAPGVTYTYLVAAFDADGESATDDDTGTRTLTAPTDVAATDGASETEVTVTWTDNSRVETGYEVYRQADGEAEATLVGTTAARATSFTDDTPDLGVTYTYSVLAIDAHGTSAAASDGGYTAILPPVSVNASDAYDDRVVLTWVDVSEVDDGYRIYRDGAEITTTGETLYTDTDAALVAGVSYAYCVEAYRDGGAASEQVCDDGSRADDDGGALADGAAPLVIALDGTLVATSVAVSGDRALFAQDEAGAFVYTYDAEADVWAQEQALGEGDASLTDNYGYSGALDGDRALVGAPDLSGDVGGVVYVYERDPTTGAWSETAQITGSVGDGLGYDVALSGDHALILADEEEQAYLYAFDNTDGTWSEAASFATDSRGAIALRDDWAFVEAAGGRQVEAYLHTDGSWALAQTINPSSIVDLRSLALHDDYALIGGEGVATVFAWNADSGQWEEGQALTVEGADSGSGDTIGYGAAVAINDAFALVGEPLVSDGDGYAYLFQRTGSAWVETDRWTPASAPVWGFGGNLALGHGFAVIGSVADVYAQRLVEPPDDVSATDGSLDGQVKITWTDRSALEENFQIYRNGRLIASTGPDIRTYSDFDAAPGILHTYCVSASNDAIGESVVFCDEGWRPANGTISGRVASEAGGGIDSVTVCLDPAPHNALLLDGDGGHALIDDLTLEDDLTAFTVAFWMKSGDTEQAGTPLSYNLEGNDNLLTLYDYRDLELIVDGTSTGATGVSANDGAWHHLALSWQSSDGALVLYKDGERVYEAAGHATGASIPGGGVLVFGQEQDAPGGGFETAQAFKGQLDEVQLWSVALDSAAVQALMTEPLVGEEDDLAGYWPLDQDHALAGISPELSGTPNHATLADGAYTTEDAAPLDVCVLTDLDGNYTLSGLPYGETTTFTLTPTKDVRQFEPAAKTITLSVESPVQNEVFFEDVSSLTLSGVVTFASPFDATTCPAEDIGIYLGAPGEERTLQTTTERDGAYSLAVDLGEWVVEPVLIDSEDGGGDGLTHTFSPSSATVDVQDTVTGIDFTDTSLRTLTGFVGGNCGYDIGPVTIKVYTADGCFTHEEEITDGTIDLDLPPQTYFVEVVEVDPPPALSKADVIAFFDGLGAQQVDLTLEDDTLDLIYQAPLEVTLDGFPAPPSSCTVLTEVDEDANPLREIPLVPVLADGEVVTVNVLATQVYSDTQVCPVEEGTVTIYDGIADKADTPVVLDLENGQASYTTFGASPNVFAGAFIDGADRSFQKPFTADVEVPDLDPVSTTEWVIVEGHLEREATFVSAVTDEIPTLVLHDPPGSNSYSYLEEGFTSCSSIARFDLEDNGSGVNLDVATGFKSGQGIGVSIENGVGLLIRLTTREGEERLELDDGADNFEICTTVTERFATYADATWVGEDIYIGVALNVIVAEADNLAVDPAACTLDLYESLAMDVDDADPFETTYVYGQSHIEYSLIPALEELIELSGGESVVDGDLDGEATSITLQNALDNWNDHLTANAENIAAGLKNPVENRSFSAGAEYEYSAAVDSAVITHAETVNIYNNTEVSFGAVATRAGYDQELSGTWVINRADIREELDTETTSSLKGYVLSDGDTGDFFSVDVGTDPVYGTPVFGVVSGRSSNPWESGTQKRDNPVIEIFPAELSGLSPDEAGTFALTLTNASESGEQREYKMRVPGETNPRNLGLTVTGDLLGGDRIETFLLDAGESLTINLDVFPAPSAYAYEDVGVMLYPGAEFDIWMADPRQPFALSDTAFFNVYFDAPCSGITMLRPLENWTYTAADVGEALEVILHEFALVTDDGDALSTIRVDYRALGSAEWVTLATTTAEALGEDATEWIAEWDPTTIGDGSYELRAATSCTGEEEVYSEVVPGTVDTAPPAVFGTPEPADNVLHLGDDISLTFNEAIDCALVDADGTGDDNVTLHNVATGDLIPVVVVCDGNGLVLTPDPDLIDLDVLENATLRATLVPPSDVLGAAGDTLAVSAVTDAVGNPIEEAVTWEFLVKQSAVSFSPLTLEVDVTRGFPSLASTTLTNGRAGAVSFTLPDSFDLVQRDDDGQETDRVAVAPSETSGEIISGGTAFIDIDLPRTLEAGLYDGVLEATLTDEDEVALGNAFFSLNVNVLCRLPVEVFPAEFFTSDLEAEAAEKLLNTSNFEYTMTMTAEVVVDDSVSTDSADAVLAFVDGEVRGLSFLEETSPGTYLANMVIYSNEPSGEVVTFQIWDKSSCLLLTDVGPALTFASNDVYGTASSPDRIQSPAPEGSEQVIAFSAGWTWFSYNRAFEADGVTYTDSVGVNVALAGLSPAFGDVLKSNDDAMFMTFADTLTSGLWLGAAPDTFLHAGEGYQISLSRSGTLLLDGDTLDAAAIDIPLSIQSDGEPGWNWVGYLPEAALPIDEALAGMDPAPATDDLIKSQVAFAQYVEGSGWIGSLDELEPGQAYQMLVAQAGTLTYPSNAAAAADAAMALPAAAVASANGEPLRRAARLPDEAPALPAPDGAAPGGKPAAPQPGVRAEDDGAARAPLVDPYAHRYDMTLTAEVLLDDGPVARPGLRVEAFVGRERRGAAPVTYVPALGGYRAFLTVYSNKRRGETVRLVLYDPDADARTDLGQTLVFEHNAVRGRPSAPLRLSADVATSLASGELPTRYELGQNYPNPFNPVTTIRYALPRAEEVRLHVYDVLGRQVMRLVDDRQQAGRYEVVFDASRLASGVYFYRLEAGAFADVKRMVVLK